MGEQFLQAGFCPLVASASLSGWLFLWETSGAAEGAGGPSSLPFFEDFWGSPCGMAGPLLLFTGGKPRVELYELVMAFLLGQELIQEVWRVLLELSSGLLAWRFLCRGPGLGTNKVTPRGLNADRVPPVPSGPLLWSLFPPMTVGTSSCLAIPFPLSPRALNAVCSVLQLGTQLGVVGGTGCPRATLTVTVSTADTELRDIVEVRAPITAFFRWPRLQMEIRTPRKERRACGMVEWGLRDSVAKRRCRVTGHLWAGLRVDSWP